MVFVLGFGFLFFLTLLVKHDLNTVETVQEHPHQERKQQQRTKQNKSKGIYTDQATKNNENPLDSVVLSVDGRERRTQVLICVLSHRKTLGPGESSATSSLEY